MSLFSAALETGHPSLREPRTGRHAQILAGRRLPACHCDTGPAERPSASPFPMKDSAVTSGRRVLVIDGPTETGEVLKAVLEPRGVMIDRVRSHSAVRLPEDSASPRVVVVHARNSTSEETCGTRWNNIPSIVIGAETTDGDGPLNTSARPSEHFPEPFDYDQLVRAIERLLR